MREFTVSNEQIRQFSLDCYDAIISSIKAENEAAARLEIDNCKED